MRWGGCCGGAEFSFVGDAVLADEVLEGCKESDVVFDVFVWFGAGCGVTVAWFCGETTACLWASGAGADCPVVIIVWDVCR